jgi:V8-like Glu-specific endopeptidase
MRCALLLLITFIFSACASTDRSQHSERLRIPANDGTASAVDSVLFRHSVKIVMDRSGGCSGYVIDPRRIVTAAHCFREIETNKTPKVDFEFIVGGVSIPRDLKFKIFVARAFDPTEERSSANSGDVALIVFAKPVAQAPFLKVSLNLSVKPTGSDEYTSIGYGPSPRESEALDALGAREVKLKPMASDEPRKLRFQQGPVGEGMVCVGDSGSPVFVRHGEELLMVGVLSSTIASSSEEDIKWAQALTSDQRLLPENKSRLCRIETGESFWTRTQAYPKFFAQPERSGRLVFSGP